MATHDYNLANQSGASFRSDLNDALQAVLTNNSSASAPSTTAAYMFWADTNTGTLKIRNSSNDAWVELLQLDGTLTIEDGSASAVGLGFRDELNTGIFSSGASNFDVAIAGTTRLNISATGLNVTGTVTDDGATHDGDVTFTGASANVVFDKSDNALEFADNAKAVFGAGSDLQISHDGSNSIINDNGSGQLQLQRAGNTILELDSGGITVTDPDGDANVSIKGFEGQSAKLELIADEGDDNGDTWTLKSVASDNDFVIQNNSTGSNVTLVTLDTSGNLSIPTDTGRLKLGASDDLQIYHDGSNSFIRDMGTGVLFLDTDGTKIQLAADGTSSKTLANFIKDGAVELYHSGNLRFTTSSDGAELTGLLNIINGATSLIHMGQASGDFSYRLRANVSSSVNGGFLIEDGNSSADLYKVVSGSSGSHAFFINGTQKMQLSSSGTLRVGTTSTPSQGDDGASFPSVGIHVVARDTASSSVFRAFGANGEFRTRGDGDAENTNNSYTGTSDQELKENIVDANSQWDDIKALKVRNYNFKESTKYNTHKQIGVIAQELEASGMSNLVTNNVNELYVEGDEIPEGKNIGDIKEVGYKSVKYSVLYMKAIKALQEAITKIETLETKVAALEAG
jgi:flagellar basal body rod protein FlgF